jgi:hypothetical protein
MTIVHIARDGSTFCGDPLTGAEITSEMPACGRCMMLLIASIEEEVKETMRALRALEAQPLPFGTPSETALSIHRSEGLDGVCGSDSCCICTETWATWEHFLTRTAWMKQVSQSWL